MADSNTAPAEDIEDTEPCIACHDPDCDFDCDGTVEDYDGDERLHLSLQRGIDHSYHRLDLTTGSETRAIGTIRQLSGGAFSWTVTFKGDDRTAALVDDGVAATLEIASRRQFAALEEHDPARFGWRRDALDVLRSSVQSLVQACSDMKDLTEDVADVIARSMPKDSDPFASLNVKELLLVSLPEHATLEGYLECHGSRGLGETAQAALDRLVRIYGPETVPA